MRQIAIIGGGFSGAAVAIRLADRASSPLTITIVEPRETLGAGLAYGGDDPDHRVNGTHALLVLFPDDIGHFARWYDSSGAAARDPEAKWLSGVSYVRRSDVHRYMAETLASRAKSNPSGSVIRHIRDRAVGARRTKGRLHVELASGSMLAANLTVLALGGQKPAPLQGISPDAARCLHYLGDPFAPSALAAVPADAPVLLVGTGLTAADVIATLARQGHRGPITAISRRGLRPAAQGKAPDVAALLTRLALPTPRFIARHGEGLSLRATFRALRRDFAEAATDDRDPKGIFDDVRDAASRLWSTFSEAEKRSFLRHIKPWYDVNRYRIPPQTQQILARLETAGQLKFRVARFAVLEMDGDYLRAQLVSRGGFTTEVRFGAVINCTGPQTMPPDRFLNALRDLGVARFDTLGLGVEVDGEGRLLDANGIAQESLWAFGLLTRGRFGDMTAIPQIAFRLHRSLPALCMAASPFSHPAGCKADKPAGQNLRASTQEVQQ